jgi:hypothetical protein
MTNKIFTFKYNPNISLENAFAQMNEVIKTDKEACETSWNQFCEH